MIESGNSVQKNAKRVPELAKFQPMVYLIWGAGDPYLNMGVAKHIASHFPNAKLSAIRVGHWPQLDNPEKVAELLLAP